MTDDRHGFPFGGYGEYWTEMSRLSQFQGLSKFWEDRDITKPWERYGRREDRKSQSSSEGNKVKTKTPFNPYLYFSKKSL